MNKTDSSHNPSDRQKLEDIGYPYLKSKKEDGSYNVPTLNESLYWRYAAGIISLHDAAREFTSHGWTNFVDEDFTKKEFAEIDLKYHKLDYDLKPLSPEQIAMQKVEQQIEDFKTTTGIQLEIRDNKPYYDGFMNLSHENRSLRLPDNLVVTGSLILSFSNIEKLPENLQVGGNLQLQHTPIKELPGNLKVGMTLGLEDTQIKELPDTLKVGGSLFLRHTEVSKLPENLTINGSLDLRETPIENLPPNLIVKGNLHLNNTHVKELPDNLKVMEWLDLRNTQIQELPSNLKVGKQINMDDSIISKTPDVVTPDGYIDLVKAGAPIAQKQSETLTPKDYTTMWMTSIAEETPKDRPSDIVFIKDFNLEDTSKPIYTAYGKDADRLAEKISSSVAAMRPEIEGKRYPYADISGSKIEAVRADLMINNVHPIIIDVEGYRITNDTILDFTKEERKAFLDSLKPESKEREKILKTLQDLGNPEHITIPHTGERYRPDHTMMIPHRFGYQEISLTEIKRSKDGNYRAGNSEEGFYPISKMNSNNLFEVQQALQKVVANRSENLIRELINQTKEGKAHVERGIVDGLYNITINDRPHERNYPRGFISFTIGKDLNDYIIHNSERVSRILKIDSQTAKELVNYAESKLGLANIHPTQIADVSQKFEASVTQRQGQAYMTAKVDDRQLDSKQISKQDWADYKNHKTSAQQLINKYYSKEEISQANPQKLNSGRGR